MSYNRTNYMHQFIFFFFKFFNFWSETLQVSDSFSVHHQLASCQKTCMTYHSCMYSGKLLMMARGTVRNM